MTSRGSMDGDRDEIDGQEMEISYSDQVAEITGFV